LSPYAVTKKVNELYAAVFQDKYDVAAIGLRYFNVFGPRQDPDGPYAAVIPRWIKALMAGEPCVIFGDGGTSRDFCYVDNAVQANLLAAHCPPAATGTAYNVAYGGRVTLNELYEQLRSRVEQLLPGVEAGPKVYEHPRPGDIRHSQADLENVTTALGYEPAYDLARGLDVAMPWYVRSSR
jgi:UDP-N-acetylglucosamine 4-epimerase